MCTKVSFFLLHNTTVLHDTLIPLEYALPFQSLDKKKQKQSISIITAPSWQHSCCNVCVALTSHSNDWTMANNQTSGSLPYKRKLNWVNFISFLKIPFILYSYIYVSSSHFRGFIQPVAPSASPPNRSFQTVKVNHFFCFVLNTIHKYTAWGLRQVSIPPHWQFPNDNKTTFMIICP